MQISRRKMIEKQKLLNVYYKNKYLLDVDMKAMAFARHLTINQILLTSSNHMIKICRWRAKQNNQLELSTKTMNPIPNE